MDLEKHQRLGILYYSELSIAVTTGDRGQNIPGQTGEHLSSGQELSEQNSLVMLPVVGF